MLRGYYCGSIFGVVEYWVSWGGVCLINRVLNLSRWQTALKTRRAPDSTQPTKTPDTPRKICAIFGIGLQKC